MNPEWYTSCDERLSFRCPLASVPSLGSTMVGGASSVDDAPGRSSGLIPSPLAGDMDRELPKPKGNDGRGVGPEPRLPLEGMFFLSNSASGGENVLILGLGGTSPSLGDASLDGSFGVNECERVCTLPLFGVSGGFVRLTGEDEAEPPRRGTRCGGDEEGLSAVVTEGKGYAPLLPPPETEVAGE